MHQNGTLYTYVVVRDAGFAPNPYGGWCSLATCKPAIRRTAKVGDFIVGTSSVAGGAEPRLVFAMEVGEKVTIEEYGSAERFALKRPTTSGELWQRAGDNIYFCESGTWKQRPSYHGPDQMTSDLAGRYVLIGTTYWYFGGSGPPVPPRLRAALKFGPGHKKVSDGSLIRDWRGWLETLPRGKRGEPADRHPRDRT